MSTEVLLIMFVFVSPVFVFVLISNFFEKKKLLALQEKILKMNAQERGLVLQKLIAEERRYETSHILHFFLSILCLGFWVFVWILVASSNQSKRKQIQTMQGIVTGEVAV